MPIHIEFFGVARQLAGQACMEVSLPPPSVTVRLEAVFQEIARQQPALGKDCLMDGKLGDSFLANLDGERFVRDPETLVRDGQSLLILSADAGG